MKKLALLTILLFGFGFAIASCDFGEEESEDAYEDGGEDTGVPDAVPDAEPDETEPPVGETCAVGDSFGWNDANEGLYFAKVEDDLTNKTLETCGGGNPGADIDAVCLYDAGGTTLKSCATEVTVDGANVTDCENDKDDPETVKGPPDGVAGPDEYVGYFSLNGRAIIVGFDSNEILCGDLITVTEMWNSEVAGSEENWKLSVGKTEDGPWAEKSDWGTGEADVDITWTWE